MGVLIKEDADMTKYQCKFLNRKELAAEYPQFSRSAWAQKPKSKLDYEVVDNVAIYERANVERFLRGLPPKKGRGRPKNTDQPRNKG